MDIEDTASTSKKPAQKTTDQLLQQTQSEVDEIVDIMRGNVVKVLERDHKLSDLDKRADALQKAASQFKQGSHKLKRKHYWANVKMRVTLSVIVAVIVVAAIIALVWPKEDHPSTASPTETPQGNS